MSDDKTILATAYELLEDANSKLLEGRQVAPEAIRELVRRELPEVPRAYRSTISFLTTVENPTTNTPTRHTDLLPAGHPLSTVTAAPATLRKAASEYFSADPDLSEDLRPLIASAIAAEPTSAARMFYTELLYAKGTSLSVHALIEEADRTVNNRGEIDPEPASN